VDNMHQKPPHNVSTGQTNETFEVLALRYLDGVHTSEELQKLSELLESDSQSRDAFAALSVQIGSLSEMAVAAQREGLGGPDSSPLQSTDSTAPLIFGDVGSVQPQFDGGWLGFFSRTPWLMLVAAMLGGFAVWLLQPGGADQSAQVATTASGRSPMPLEVRSVHIESGSTKLLLPRVGYVVVEGPADLDLLGPMRARLNSGRIK
jgi:hypothetical protein